MASLGIFGTEQAPLLGEWVNPQSARHPASSGARRATISSQDGTLAMSVARLWPSE